MICGSIDTILATLLLLTIPNQKANGSPKLEKPETKNDVDVQEANVSIEEEKNENTEKDTFLNESNSSNETTSTDRIGKSVLGY